MDKCNDNAGKPIATNSSHTRTFRAPGRANIIGEHTDYNDGYVLPTNTALFTRIAITPRDDRIIRVTALRFANTETFDLDNIGRGDKLHWVDYLKGVAVEIEAAGFRLRGADIVVDGNIPLGGGLSSSASLELAAASAMLAISSESVSDLDKAIICQRAERNFVGVNCGIMDQYSIACCTRDEAILLDCRDLTTQSVRIPGSIRFLLTDSGVKHGHAASGYNNRAEECRQATSILCAAEEDKASLRDVPLDRLENLREKLGDVLYRRSRHVITEIQRTREAFEILGSDDVFAIGDLVSASHASLRDDFEVSCDEVESLVAIADRTPGVLGSRQVGGGFGGCVLSVVEASRIDAVTQEIASQYKAVSGDIPWTHVVTPANPVEEVRT